MYFAFAIQKIVLPLFLIPKKNKRVFNLTNFLKYDLKLKSDFLYRLPSGVAHGKLYLARILTALREGENTIQLDLD